MAEVLEVQARQEGDIGVVATDGYINNTGAEKIADVCTEMLDQGVKLYLLNLEKSRIINSIGISILIEVIEKVNAIDGRIAFCCVTPTIEKTFRIMGLLKRSSVFGSEEDGLAGLRS